VLLLLLASIAAVLLAAALPDTILAGDTVNYRERMVELFAGKVPYFEFAFEHQPVMILPMALAWLLGGASGQPAYVLAFASLSFSALAATTAVLGKVDRHWAEGGLALRFVILVIPLLPLLLFRNDSFSVLLTAAGGYLLITGKIGSGLVTTVVGVLSKIWSGVLGAILIWRRRWIATGIVVLTVAGALAINFSPSVQEIQQGEGIHTETLAGSALGLYRVVSRVPLDINRAATAFLDGPAFLLVINLVASLPILWLVFGRLREPFEETSAWMILGALTAALLLASPFFSPQYIAWVLPFAAFRRRFTVVAFILSIASIAMALGWYSLFEGAPWWWGLTLARNLGLLMLGIEMARQVTPKSADSLVS
jgi:hypothetical protein